MCVVISRTPLSQLTDTLSKVLQTPVVDMTGLTGRYDPPSTWPNTSGIRNLPEVVRPISSGF